MESHSRNTIASNADERIDLRNEDIFRFVEEVDSHGRFPNSTEVHRVDGIDVTITSPPYADLKDYGYAKNEQIGQDPYDKYLEDLREVFSAVYDVTSDTGTLWVVANTVKKNGRMLDLPFDIADVCQDLEGTEYCPECQENDIKVPLQGLNDYSEKKCVNCGYETEASSDSWILQDIVIWDKTRALPYSGKGSFRNIFEYILCFSKTDDFKFDLDSIRVADPGKFKDWWVSYPERYHPRGKLPDNIWKFLTPTQGWTKNPVDHPAPFPPKMVERLVRLTTEPGDTVFDPFAGSGTVLAQAGVMERKAVGYELSEKYCKLFEDVLEDISEKWQNRQSSAGSIEKRQNEFTQLIGSLRQIRQIREMVRTLRKEENYEEEILGIVHNSISINNPSTAGRKFAQSEMKIITTSEADAGEVAQQISGVLNSPPCSKFGIDVAFEVVPFSDISTAGAKIIPDEAFVYENGRHNVFKERYSAERIVTEIRRTGEETCKKYPPIFSNLGLEIPDPRKKSTSGDNIEYTLTTISNTLDIETPISLQINPRAAD